MLLTLSLLSSLLLALHFSRNSPQPKFVRAGWGLMALGDVALSLDLVLLDQILSWVAMPALMIWMYWLRYSYKRSTLTNSRKKK